VVTPGLEPGTCRLSVVTLAGRLIRPLLYQLSYATLVSAARACVFEKTSGAVPVIHSGKRQGMPGEPTLACA
jgi:hypothetical protein